MPVYDFLLEDEYVAHDVIWNRTSLMRKRLTPDGAFVTSVPVKVDIAHVTDFGYDQSTGQSMTFLCL